jgi:nucleolar protein 58
MSKLLLKKTGLLQVLNEKKLQEVDSLWKEFETPEKANKM